MAYDYLGLVNDLAARIGEVQLTSANFSTSIGIYSQMKQAVNDAIHDINHRYFQWPFNHVELEKTLTIGENRYTFPETLKVVNMDSFRIKRNTSQGVETRKLIPITYENWLNNKSDEDYNTNIYAVPRYVFRTLNFGFGVSPAPDKAYVVTYEYFTLPVALVDHDDVPTIPSQFRTVVVDAATYYLQIYKGDIDAADRMQAKYERGLREMKGMYINRFIEVSTPMKTTSGYLNSEYYNGY